MKLLFNTESLRKRIATDPDDEPTAGNDDGLRRVFDSQGCVVLGLRMDSAGRILTVKEPYPLYVKP